MAVTWVNAVTATNIHTYLACSSAQSRSAASPVMGCLGDGARRRDVFLFALGAMVAGGGVGGAFAGLRFPDCRTRSAGALAFLDKQDSVPAIRADLQAALDKVIAEQDDRAKIATDA